MLAEPGEIEQILLNLVANSRDAMPDGGELRVETQATDDGASVTLSVSDTGNGMDEETKSRLFEPFFTTKGVGQGTGLGLSTVFAVARQRGGEIRVDSQPGRGTVVTVQVAGGGAQPDQPDRARRHAARDARRCWRSRTIRWCARPIEGDLRALGYTTLMAGHPGGGAGRSRARRLDRSAADRRDDAGASWAAIWRASSRRQRPDCGCCSCRRTRNPSCCG